MDLTLQELADQYYAARSLRLDKEREAFKLQEVETELKGQLIHAMLEEKLTVVGGQSCIVRYHRKLKPIPEDWTKVWGHIQSTGEFELLQKRLTDSAIQERWDNGIEVPGIGRFPIDDITVSAIK
jgi:hypothetical protein